MEKIVIREADKKDARNISAVARCVWVDTYAENGVFDRISEYVESELSEKKILERIETDEVFVCERDNGLLGYAVISKESEKVSEIRTLYVLPKQQGRGVGKSLLDYVLEREPKIYWLSMWYLNKKALNFYIRYGFREKGESFFDLYGKKIKNLILEIDL